jgi:hypothetical protein
MSRQNDIENLITNHSRRLQKLKEKQALVGLSVDPHILLEIEDIEAEISRLQLELDDLEHGTKSSSQISIARRPIWRGVGVVIAVLSNSPKVLCTFLGG